MAEPRQTLPVPDPEPPAWQQTILATLDAGARDLDAATLSRLNRARQLALRQLPTPHTHRTWLLAGAATAALALVVLLRPGTPPGAGLPTLPATAMATEDFELLSSEEAALYSDIEFYAWLALQERGG